MDLKTTIDLPSTTEYDSCTSIICGGPPSPISRSGVEGLLMRSSRSCTLGRRTSIEVRLLCFCYFLFVFFFFF